MSNDIKSLLPSDPRRSGVAATGSPARENKASGPAGPAAAPSNEEKVTFTDTAQKMARMSAEAAKGPTVDQAKVKELRAAVEAGLYRADPRAIADALIRFERS